MKMYNLKGLRPVLSVIAAICLLIGLILLAFLAPNASSRFYRVICILLATSIVLLGAALLLLVYLSCDRHSNFFLYDPKTGRNMSEETLTFERVNSRMSYFMSKFASSQEELWGKNVFDESPQMLRDVYKPLTAYKMLYDLIEFDAPEAWAFFLGASAETVHGITEALEANGEDRMSRALEGAYENAASPDDIDWLRDYVMGNEKYIRRRMMEYVRRNMDWFY